MKDSITSRIVSGRDHVALPWLQANESRRAIRGWSMVAERDGSPVAAIALMSGSVVADPRHDTDEAVRHLRRCRNQILGGSGGHTRTRSRPQPLVAQAA
jgi:hypothetical protein